MNISLSAFKEAFPFHKVDFKPRPDGTWLLILELEGCEPFRKAICGEALYDEWRAGQIIRELLRELKLTAGEALWRGPGIDWVSRELPTYYGGPIQMTAAKTLVARRKLEHERRAGAR